MAEFRIEGPFGANLTGDTGITKKHTLGAKLVTQDANGRKRIYRYTKAHGAHTAGVAYVLGSNSALLYAANATNAVGQAIGVPQVAITSSTAATYQWTQTGGEFNDGGEQSGVGILVTSATAGQQMYLSATAGSLTSTPSATKPVRVPGLKATTNASSDEVYAYSHDELYAVDDLLA